MAEYGKKAGRDQCQWASRPSPHFPNHWNSNPRPNNSYQTHRRPPTLKIRRRILLVRCRAQGCKERKGMCIAVFLWQAHPICQLYLLHNRDEYHERPADPLRWWDDRGILGGRDGQAGGTWLACSRRGRVAFVTNVREVGKLDQPRSRGDLPVRFLESKESPSEFADEILKELHQYNGFNLIVAHVVSKTMLFITNRPAKAGDYVAEVTPGIHVLSNASLDTPWPKAQLLRRGFEELMEGKDRGELPDTHLALELMTNRTKDGENLPGILAPEWEYMLSSAFVEAETPSGLYGTRSMSALCVRTDGEVEFHEKCVDDGEWKEHHVSYRIESNV